MQYVHVVYNAQQTLIAAFDLTIGRFFLTRAYVALGVKMIGQHCSISFIGCVNLSYDMETCVCYHFIISVSLDFILIRPNTSSFIAL